VVSRADQFHLLNQARIAVPTSQERDGSSRLCLTIHVAGGSILISQGVLHAASWSVDKYTFISDLRILQLKHYDLIIGMDWLEQYSPMQVHWQYKWVEIPYQGIKVRLHGLMHQDDTTLVL